jgi:hypothetical protein
MDRELIAKRWVHSHEEDHGEIKVYRLATFPFPPSRGRDELDLRQVDEMRQTASGSTDRRETNRGCWTTIGDVLEITIGTTTRRWTVVAITEDQLDLKKA